MNNPFWFRSDWINPFRTDAYNWIDFTIINVNGEYDRRFGNIEFHVALLGFHIGGQWKVSAGDAGFQEKLQGMMDEVMSGDARVSITLNELKDLQKKAGMEHAP